MKVLPNIWTLSEAEAALANHGVATDTVYRDVLDYSGYRFGVQRDNHGIHVYFNEGRSNKAYFTPALGTLAIFDQPRRDDMVGQKHYLRRPPAVQTHALSAS